MADASSVPSIHSKKDQSAKIPQTRPEHPLHRAPQTFASTVTAKMAQLTTGSPEDPLRTPFETFMAAAVQTLG